LGLNHWQLINDDYLEKQKFAGNQNRAYRSVVNILLPKEQT